MIGIFIFRYAKPDYNDYFNQDYFNRTARNNSPDCPYNNKKRVAFAISLKNTCEICQY